MYEDWEYDAKKLCLELLEEGMLCKQTHGNKIRLTPPLIVQKEQIDDIIEKVTAVMNRLS